MVDLAHNEAGVAALLEVLRGLGGPDASVRLVDRARPGDRTDEIIRGVGEIAARGADQVVIAHKEHYLRGRDADELAGLLREGAAAVGVHDVPVHPTELAGLQALVDQCRPRRRGRRHVPRRARRDRRLAGLGGRHGGRPGRDPRQGPGRRGALADAAATGQGWRSRSNRRIGADRDCCLATPRTPIMEELDLRR